MKSKKNEQNQANTENFSEAVESPPSSPPPKKKRRGCAGGCMRFLKNVTVVVFALFAITLTVGYFVGDHYSKQYLGLPAADVVGIFSGLANANESKVVAQKDKFGEADLDAFYTSFKDKLFLSESFDLKKKLNDSLEEQIEKLKESDALEDIFKSDFEESQDSEENDEDGADKSDLEKMMDAVLADLLKAENFNLKRIREFDYDNPQPFTDMVIVDKQVAAFINSFLTADYIRDFTNETLTNLTEGYATIDARISVKKISLFSEVDDYREKTGEKANGDITYVTKTGEVKKLGVTMAFELRAFMKALLDDYGFGFVAPLLPKEIYFTAEISLDKDCAPMAYINNMNSRTMKNAFTLARAITGLIGNEMDLEKTIGDMNTTTIFPLLESVNKFVPLSEIKDGKLTLEPFEVILGFLIEESDDPDFTRPTGADLFMMVQAILVADEDEIIEHPYRDTYIALDGTVHVGLTEAEMQSAEMQEALASGIIVKEGDKYFVDHIQVFKNELLNKYYVDIGDIDDLLGLLGMGGKETEDEDDDNIQPTSEPEPEPEPEPEGEDEGDIISKLMDKFSYENFRRDLVEGSDNLDDYKLVLTDYAMAALIQEVLGTLEVGDVDLSMLEVGQVLLTEKEDGNGKDRQYIQITLSLNVKSVLDFAIKTKEGEEDSFIKVFLKDLIDDGQLPSKLFLSVVMDISYEADDDGNNTIERAATYFWLNSMSGDKTDKMITLLKSFGFDLSEMVSEMVDGAVGPMLDNMYGMLPIVFTQSQAELPSIFELIVTVMQIEIDDEGTVRQLTGAELRKVLVGLEKGTAIDDNTNGMGDDYLYNMPDEVDEDEKDALYLFFEQLEEQYYLEAGTLTIKEIFDNESGQHRMETYAEARQRALDMMMGKGTTDLFDDPLSIIRTESAGGQVGLYDDNTEGGGLTGPKLSDKALAEIVKEQLSGDVMGDYSAELMQVAITRGNNNEILIELTMKIELDGFLDSDGGAGFNLSNMLPDVMYLRAYCNTSVLNAGGDGYATEIRVNNVSTADMKLINALIEGLVGSNMFESVSDTIGTNLYDALENIKGVLDFDLVTNQDGKTGAVAFESFYSFLANSLDFTFENWVYGDIQDPTLREIKFQALWTAYNNDYPDRQIHDRGEFLSYLESEFHPTLKAAIKGMNYGKNYEPVLQGGDEQIREDYLDNLPVGGELDTFFLELEDKYYIQRGQFSGGDGIEKIKGGLDITGDLSTLLREKAEEQGELEAGETAFAGLLDDTRTPDQLALFMPDKALLAVVETMLGESADFPAEILQFKIFENADNEMILETKLRAELSAIMGNGISDFGKLLPEVLYLTATSKLSDVATKEGESETVSYYETELVINNLNESQMILLSNLLEKIAGEGTVSLDSMADNIGQQLYVSFDSMKDSLGFEFVDGGLQIRNFFAMLSDNMGLSKEGYEAASGLALADETEFHALLQSTLQNMDGEKSTADLIKGTVLDRAITLSDTDVVNANIIQQEVSIADEAFGTFLDNNVSVFWDEGSPKNDIGKIKAPSIAQTMLLDKDDEDDIDYFEKYIVGKTLLSNNGQDSTVLTDLEDVDLMVFTLSINASVISVMSGIGVIPDTIYFTCVYDVQTGQNLILVNEYTQKQQAMFFYIMNGVNVEDDDSGEPAFSEQDFKDIMAGTILDELLDGATIEHNKTWTENPSGHSCIVYDLSSGNVPPAVLTLAGVPIP